MSNDHIVFYEDEEWTAVYVNGSLVRVGDSYLADEWLREHCDVETVQSDAFMRGSMMRQDVAQTLEEVYAYEAEVRAREQEVEEKQAAIRELKDELSRLRGDVQ